MDGMWSNETTSGLFAKPSEYTNTNCRHLVDWVKGEQGCWILCGASGTGKSGELRLLIDQLEAAEPETIVLAYSANSFGTRVTFDVIASHQLWQLAEKENRKIVLILDGFDQSPMNDGLPFLALATWLSSQFNMQSIATIRIS